MKSVYIIAISAAIILFTSSCAKQASPTGGPKDTEPPVPLRSMPINYATNYKGKKFIVEFDEFIDLKNVNQELIVSPPVEKKPKVVMRGKKMVVRINNELKDSTTYNFNFFNSITDLNEGNVLENFQFEFSTGETFDSTYLGGQLINSFNGKPIDGAYIMLYRQLDDSTPRTTKPECVGKTNKEGYFIVPNMRPIPYYIFALKDMNNNMLFDLPNESIAFSDSSFLPSFRPMEVEDTLHLIESISRNKKDTVFRDSIHRYTIMVTTIDDIKLNMFTEEFKIQYLHDIYRKTDRQCAIAFNTELDSEFKIQLLMDSTYNENWFLIEGSQPTDSVVFWITDTAIFKKDTIKMSVSYTMFDTINYVKTDTLNFIYDFARAAKVEKEKEKKGKGGKFLSKIIGDENTDNQPEEEVKKESELKIAHNIKQKHDLKQPIVLTTRYPIKNLNINSIKLSKIEDENETNVKFEVEKDSISERIFRINFETEEATDYKLIVPEGSFTDIYGNINDSLKTTFSTKTLDNYCSIIMNIKGVKNRSIVQLLDSKEKALKEFSISADTTLTIEYLNANTYIFKLFYDENGNGVWDTGKYSEHRQPEKVFYYGETIEGKAGWDMEYTWIVE